MGLRTTLLRDVPRIDRFFPSCHYGLIELVARWKFGLPDIKRVWLNHGFVYERPPGEIRLRPDGVNLDLSLSSPTNARDDAAAKLLYHHGIELDRDPYDDCEELLTALADLIDSGELPISLFDMGFLACHRTYRKDFRPHLLGIVGVDVERSLLIATEQVKGRVEVSMQDYRDCFQFVRSSGRPFFLIRCRRTPGAIERPLLREAMTGTFDTWLQNLNSLEPHLGLMGLARAIADLQWAVRVMDRPFGVPGMWVFSHERRCLVDGLSHWVSDGVVAADTARPLIKVLESLFSAWFEVDMRLEQSIASGEIRDRAALARTLGHIEPIERQMANHLQTIHSQMRQ